jgi:uncharacterized membrane protein YhaH (DUF805 family)
MNWGAVFFGFAGRLNRAKYWLVVLANVIVWIAVVIIAQFLRESVEAIDGLSHTALAFGMTAVAALLFSVWTGLAVGVKRLHDRGKSGWWILVFWLLPAALSGAAALQGDIGAIVLSLVSIAVSLWGFVEIACLKGAPGTNVYGGDPLAAQPIP